MRIILMTILILLSFPALAQTLPEDQSALRVLAYFKVGQDDSPRTNVTIEQFTAHLDALKKR